VAHQDLPILIRRFGVNTSDITLEKHTLLVRCTLHYIEQTNLKAAPVYLISKNNYWEEEELLNANLSEKVVVMAIFVEEDDGISASQDK